MGKQQQGWGIAIILFLLGNIALADPLDHWQFTSTNTFNSIRSTPSGFIGVGAQGKLMTSPDGITWTTQNGGTNDLNDVAVGPVSETVIHPSIYYDDGWVEEGDTNTFRGNSTMVAGKRGETGVRYGVPPPTTNDLDSVVYGNGMFIVSAVTRSNTEPNLYIYNATNTFTLNWTNSQFEPSPWEPVVLGVTDYEGIDTPHYFKLSYGGGMFVAAGSIIDDIWTSTDGRHWTNRGQNWTDYYQSVVYGNGTFVANGVEGPVRTSTNGVDWVSTFGELNSPTNTILVGKATFANGLFVVTGYGNYVLVSSNGFDWSRKLVTTNASVDISTVACANGTFLLGANPWGGSGSWLSDHFKLSSVTNLALTTNGMALDLSVETGVPYTVQVSTNFQTWDDLASFTSTNSNFRRVVDTNAIDTNATTTRFYRTLAP